MSILIRCIVSVVFVVLIVFDELYPNDNTLDQ
jgi:hypothetical protein